MHHISHLSHMPYIICDYGMVHEGTDYITELQFGNKAMYGGEYRKQGNGEEGSLDHLQGLHRQVTNDIHQNNAEIKLLNNKIVKNDYDRTLLYKLETRREALFNKQRELEEIVKNQQHLHKQILSQRNHQNHFKHQLGSEYLQLTDQKRKRAQEERRRAVDQERQMHEYHRKAMEEEYVKKKQAMEEQKRAALEQLAMKEQMKAREREQKQRQKDQYNKKVMIRSQIETQKDSVYKQYYNQFIQNQEKLQNIYKNKAGAVDRERQTQRNEFEKKEIQTYQQKVNKEQEERAIRMNEEKDMLRSFLQNQMEEKNRKKSRDKEEELHYQAQVSRFQVNSMEAEQLERMKRREEQRRYDEELKYQSRLKSYSNDNGTLNTRQSHNPITNPIDFKIGITNPYIIRQYEQTKQKYLGDPQLKLRNLAMVGSNSLAQQ